MGRYRDDFAHRANIVTTDDPKDAKRLQQEEVDAEVTLPRPFGDRRGRRAGELGVIYNAINSVFGTRVPPARSPGSWN